MEVIQLNLIGNITGTRQTIEEQKAIEEITNIFKTKEVRKVNVYYEEEPAQNKCTGSKS